MRKPYRFFSALSIGWWPIWALFHVSQLLKITVFPGGYFHTVNNATFSKFSIGLLWGKQSLLRKEQILSPLLPASMPHNPYISPQNSVCGTGPPYRNKQPVA